MGGYMYISPYLDYVNIRKKLPMYFRDEKGIQFAKWGWSKGMCLQGLQGAVPTHRRPGGEGMRPLPGCWLICVFEMSHLSLWESTWDREHPYHLECLLGPMESGEAFYISEATASHSFSLSSPLYFPSSAWFSDIFTAFLCLLQPLERWIKRTRRIPSSCACSFSLSWFVFCFFSFFPFSFLF